MSDAGFIYAIGVEGSPYVKLGCTHGNVRKRLQELRVGQPLELIVIAAVFVEHRLHQTEKAIHRFLRSHRKRGEWFDYALDASMLADLVRDAQAGLLSQGAADNPFGARLCAFREERGWSQAELAERAGVPYETINRVERGAHREPRVSIAAKLARTLGVSLDVLAAVYADSEQ